VQPKPPAALIDAGLIGMDHRRGSQLLFGYSFKPIQGLIRLLVEIEYRALTDRYMQLIAKIVANPVIRYPLKLGQIGWPSYVESDVDGWIENTKIFTLCHR
jgi:hypothetical protein